MCPWHPEQQAPPALLAALLPSRSLPSSSRLQHRAQGREERNYKCFIKNLLFMKAKCGAGRSTGVRMMPNEATVQLFLSPPCSWQWMGHGCSHKLPQNQPQGPRSHAGPTTPGHILGVGLEGMLSIPGCQQGGMSYLICLYSTSVPKPLFLYYKNHWNSSV